MLQSHTSTRYLNACPIHPEPRLVLFLMPFANLSQHTISCSTRGLILSQAQIVPRIPPGCDTVVKTPSLFFWGFVLRSPWSFWCFPVTLHIEPASVTHNVIKFRQTSRDIMAARLSRVSVPPRCVKVKHKKKNKIHEYAPFLLIILFYLMTPPAASPHLLPMNFYHRMRLWVQIAALLSVFSAVPFPAWSSTVPQTSPPTSPSHPHAALFM